MVMQGLFKWHYGVLPQFTNVCPLNLKTSKKFTSSMLHLDGFVLDAEHDRDDTVRIEKTSDNHRRMPERELQERRGQQHDLHQSQFKLLQLLKQNLAYFVVL